MIRTACSIWMTALIFAFIGAILPTPSDASAPRTEYMECGYEDSVNCVWDARHMGNGIGRSFFTTEKGKVIYIPHHIAHHLLYND